jgi:hypothetical protein
MSEWYSGSSQVRCSTSTWCSVYGWSLNHNQNKLWEFLSQMMQKQCAYIFSSSFYTWISCNENVTCILMMSVSTEKQIGSKTCGTISRTLRKQTKTETVFSFTKLWLSWYHCDSESWTMMITNWLRIQKDGGRIFLICEELQQTE